MKPTCKKVDGEGSGVREMTDEKEVDLFATWLTMVTAAEPAGTEYSATSQGKSRLRSHRRACVLYWARDRERLRRGSSAARELPKRC
jgi:hypothetical protein